MNEDLTAIDILNLRGNESNSILGEQEQDAFPAPQSDDEDKTIGQETEAWKAETGLLRLHYAIMLLEREAKIWPKDSPLHWDYLEAINVLEADQLEPRLGGDYD